MQDLKMNTQKKGWGGVKSQGIGCLTEASAFIVVENKNVTFNAHLNPPCWRKDCQNRLCVS